MLKPTNSKLRPIDSKIRAIAAPVYPIDSKIRPANLPEQGTTLPTNAVARSPMVATFLFKRSALRLNPLTHQSKPPPRSPEPPLQSENPPALRLNLPTRQSRPPSCPGKAIAPSEKTPLLSHQRATLFGKAIATPKCKPLITEELLY